MKHRFYWNSSPILKRFRGFNSRLMWSSISISINSKRAVSLKNVFPVDGNFKKTYPYCTFVFIKKQRPLGMLLQCFRKEEKIIILLQSRLLLCP